MAKNTIGQFIAALRKANGMTQQEVADRLNVSNKAVSRWERDECAPDILMIPALAEMFGVTCDELLKGERIINDTSHEKAEPKIEKQLKSLVNRTVSKFKTMMFVSIALSVIGYVCMLGVSYGFYRPRIGFAVMMLFAVAAFTIAVISINRMKETKADNELFEDASDAVMSQYYNALGVFSYHSIYSVIAVIVLSLPLLIESFLIDMVDSVLDFESYFLYLIIIGALLALAFAYTKKAFYAWITGRRTAVSEKAKIARKMNMLQLGATIIATLILILFDEYYGTTLGVIAIAFLAANAVFFIVFIIRKRECRKRLMIPGIRNILMCIPAMIISSAHYTGGFMDNEVGYRRYSFWSVSNIVLGIMIAIALFAIFGIIEAIAEKHFNKN